MKAPFHILTYWHADDQAEIEPLATQVVRQMMRNTADPTQNTPGIPVFAYTGKVPEEHWKARIGEAEAGIAFVFFHDSLVIDSQWHDFMRYLAALQQEVPGYRWVPLAISKNTINHPVVQATSHHVERLYASPFGVEEALRLAVALEVGKSLYPNNPKATKALEIFISLSHNDDQGDVIASAIAHFLPTQAEIASFYDVADTRPGESFADRILTSQKQAFILVLRTDSYGSREFCRREVLQAKEHSRPVVVLNALHKGETRAFPYMGNVVQIHYHPAAALRDEELHHITIQVLMEAVRHAYQQQWLDYWHRTLAYSQEVVVLPSPPELLGLAQNSYGGPEATLLYPEPPLGEQEMKLLTTQAGNRKLVTPSQLNLPQSAKSFLRGKKIALTVSEPTGAYPPGMYWQHVYDALMELARHLLLQGATLIYGGYLGYQKEKDVNVMQLLLDLVKSYQPHFPQPHQAPLSNWLPAYIPANKELQAANLPWVNFSPQPYPAWAAVLPEDNPLNKVGALFEMRRNLAREADIQIVLGGKPEGFEGVYPGVLEEVWRFAQAGKPIYLLGGYGGVTQAIVKALSGGSPPFTVKTEVQAQARQEGEDLPEVSSMVQEIQANPNLHQGLSPEEAKTLMVSESLPEIMRLLLKGLMS